MASFNAYLPLLQQVEGGYTDNPNDNGNWTGGKKGVGSLVGTNYGISAPVYAQWIGRTPTKADMLTITKDTASRIFKAWFWDKVGADNINDQSVANIIVDHAVNAGTGAAGKLVQRVLNTSFGKNLKVDGAIGPLTISAINSVNGYALHEAIKAARLQFYKDIDQPTFINGWTNRLKEFVYEQRTAIGIGTVALVVFGIFLYSKYGKS
jgi:lysozyme family protein